MKNEIIKGIKEEFKKYNLFKIFLSVILCYILINLLECFHQYNYLSFLFGGISFAVFNFIIDYRIEKR